MRRRWNSGLCRIPELGKRRTTTAITASKMRIGTTSCVSLSTAGDLTRRDTLVAMRMFVLALALIACGKADPKPAPPPPSGSAAVTAPSHDLAIFLGDQKVATVPAADVAKWPRLDTLMPPDDRRLGRWEEIALVGTTPQSIHAPSSTYPELVPAV